MNGYVDAEGGEYYCSCGLRLNKVQVEECVPCNTCYTQELTPDHRFRLLMCLGSEFARDSVGAAWAGRRRKRTISPHHWYEARILAGTDLSDLDILAVELGWHKALGHLSQDMTVRVTT